MAGFSPAIMIHKLISVYDFRREMNASELWDTTMDPDRRILLQVTLDDAAAADDLFTVLMGEDVEQRRSFIQRNASEIASGSSVPACCRAVKNASGPYQYATAQSVQPDPSATNAS